MNILEVIKKHEGWRTYPYSDATGRRVKLKKGYLTIGYGFNIQDRGIPQVVADFWLMHELRTVAQELDRKYSWFKELDETRQGVLIDMCYNMGLTTLSTFKNTLNAVASGDYEFALPDFTADPNSRN